MRKYINRWTCEHCGKKFDRHVRGPNYPKPRFCGSVCGSYNKTGNTPHSAEVEARIREMAATGVSSRVIAETMGMTRNAVIGLCRRRGIPLLQSGGTKPGSTKRRPSIKRRPTTILNPKTVSVARTRAKMPDLPFHKLPDNDALPEHKLLGLMDLKHNNCRWIYGRPGIDMKGYCGLQTRVGSSYCEFHFRRSRSRPATAEERAKAIEAVKFWKRSA